VGCQIQVPVILVRKGYSEAYMAFSCASIEVPINGIWYNRNTLLKQCKINLKHNYSRKKCAESYTRLTWSRRKM